MVQANGVITNPHSYLALWLTCRRLQGDGQNRLLPEAGGVLDQDYMTTWAFGIIDEAYHSEQEFKRSMESDLANREEIRRRLLSQQG